MFVFALAAAAAAPLAPVSKWNVRYEDNYCLLARLYGDERKPVTFGWRALPLTDSVELVISETRRTGADFGRGEAQVDFGGRTLTGSFFSYPTSQVGTYLTRVTIDGTSFTGSDDPITVTVRPDGGRPTAFRLVNSAKAFAALQTCVDDTAKLWGIDPVAEAAIATPAEPADKAQWLNVSDYPANAIRLGQQGISFLLWKVDATGRVSDCRTAVPSGSPELDKAGCEAITRRGRYTPARDAAGKAVPSFKLQRIVWAMPGGLARTR